MESNDFLQAREVERGAYKNCLFRGYQAAREGRGQRRGSALSGSL